jgi:endonuclease III
MFARLVLMNTTFRDVYARWLDTLIHGERSAWIPILKELFSMSGVPEKGTKVLWLFARDFLQVPAFPIDRHVKRILAQYALPADSWKMTLICEQAEINTNQLARAFFAHT